MAIHALNILKTPVDCDVPQACDSTDEALIATLDALFAECCAVILERGLKSQIGGTCLGTNVSNQCTPCITAN